MPTIKKLMLNWIAYKRKEGTPIPEDVILLEGGYEILLENGNYLAKEVPLPPTLLSYEEIKAMADPLWELNSHPSEYYNKFNSEWHLRYYWSPRNAYFICPSTTSSPDIWANVPGGARGICYENGADWSYISSWGVPSS